MPSRAVALDWLQTAAGLDQDRAEQALGATGDSPLLARELAESELLARYSALETELEALVGKPSRSVLLAAELQDLDARVLWTWLSRFTARALTGVLARTPQPWPESPYALPAGKLAALQGKADRYARLSETPVRGDLLLREWLLEWARLPAREPIR